MIGDYIMVASAALSSSSQRALQKIYNRKERYGGVWFFNLLMCTAAFMFFAVVLAVDFQFNTITLAYSAVFAVCYLFTTVCIYYAIRTGPLALTNLIISFSLVIPTVYSIIFWGTDGGAFMYAGFAAVIVSICLINMPRKKVRENPIQDGGDELPEIEKPKHPDNKVSVKWLGIVLLGFLCNGLCATAQRVHQDAFPGKFRAEFMLFAMLLVSLFCLIMFFIKERKAGKKCDFKEAALPLTAGIANGLFNFLIIVLATSAIAPAVLYPLLAAAGIIAAYALSAIFFKERFTILQNMGVAIGIAAVILLNL